MYEPITVLLLQMIKKTEKSFNEGKFFYFLSVY